MKNIIPFKKDVIFKTNISEVTSISLEHTLKLEDNEVKGDFIVSGEYKVNDTSTTVEPFTLNLPFEISIDERYDASKAKLDIDDFYYEIINNNVLSVSIDVLLDRLEEKKIVTLDDLKDETKERTILDIEEDTMSEVNNRNDNKEEIKEEVESEDKREEIEEKREESKEIEEKREESKDVEEKRFDGKEKEEVEEKINSLFNQFSSDSEVYVTYNVFIVRDGDNLDSIMEKYGINEETLKQYNDLSNLQIGDKLIIPTSYERD